LTRWVALLIALCVSIAPLSARALTVVATTPDLAALSKAVGREHVKVTALGLHTQDPHWVDPRPHLALDLARADLLLVTGADLETSWLPTLQVGSRNREIQIGGRGFLDCSSLVELRNVPTGKVDRAQGDVHPTGDPHYMLDPRSVERVAVGIAKRMAALDPPRKAEYLENTRVFLQELRKARKRWEERLKAARGAEIISYHASLGYLADWFGVRVVETVEPRPGIPPNPRHVAHVVAVARAHKVRVILQETWYPTTTSRLIAKKAAASLVQIPGMPNFPAGQSYIAFMNDIVERVAKAL
jgi:zinc/manganese transport system substrate-binding protein